jgi:hypothetical protein
MLEHAQNPSTDPPAIKPAEVRQTLETILGSKYFSHAPQKRKFLRLICDFYLNNRASDLNEHLIGREVFSRGAGFHPAEDPIVRVVAHDVRKKLEMYYQREGNDDAIRLQIPAGSYEPQFTRRPSRQSGAAPAPPASISEMSGEVMSASPNRFRIWALGAGVFLLTTALVFFAFSNRDLRRQMQAAEARKIQPLSNAVWEPFLKKNDPTLLVLSNPLGCMIVAGNDPQAQVKRSIGLNSTQATEITHFTQASRPMAISNITPNPRLIPSLDTFTGVGEAVGLYRRLTFSAAPNAAWPSNNPAPSAPRT